LLRYLVVVGGAASAEQVADVLWPEAQPEHAMARLRTVLSRARSRYGPLVVRDGSVIRLAADVEVDSHRFDQLARSALAASGAEAERLAAEAVELYSADLLPLARYTDWTASARERARQRYIALLNLLADSAQTNGDLSVAIVYAQRRIDVDPLDDDAYVRLGRLLMAAERYRQAREVIDRGRAVAAELDLPIPQALVDIARQLGGR
jgi:DNA-binding SARP family transcriptional activator